MSKIFVHAMITTEANIAGKSAGSHTSAVNATVMATQQQIAGPELQPLAHPQLQAATFHPVTPLKADQLEYLLQGHPNHQLVEYVLQGI